MLEEAMSCGRSERRKLASETLGSPQGEELEEKAGEASPTSATESGIKSFTLLNCMNLV